MRKSITLLLAFLASNIFFGVSVKNFCDAKLGAIKMPDFTPRNVTKLLEGGENLTQFEKQHQRFVQRYGKNIMLTNLFVLRIDDPKKVEQLCKEKGLTVIRKIFNDEDYYVLKHHSTCRRCRRSAKDVLKNLTSNSWVKWSEQQHLLERYRRLFTNYRFDVNSWQSLNPYLTKSPPNRIFDNDVTFNDPLYKHQWYLHNEGQVGTPPEHDINVLPVWREGITGKGVKVLVLDDGVRWDNAEVAENYDYQSSADFTNFGHNFVPVAENSHGTYCAAIVAGVANNSICGVGVAYEAKVGGIRLLNGDITDAKEAMSLVHALEHVDIYTASWGPMDDGAALSGPGWLARMAFLKGVTKGRKGKGAIYVWAAGNGGRYYDNCNTDGYASSPYTLTFGALTEDGRSTYYSEPCAAVIASTYVGGFHSPPSKEKIRQAKKKIKVIVPEGKGKCRETFQGTSAAAPMAAGVIALVLQVNPSLSWRDVQHLIVETSRIPRPIEKGWSMNAAGKHFHLKIGFGSLDAHRMVTAAKRWSPVSPLHVWVAKPFTRLRYIRPNSATVIHISIPKATMPPMQQVDRLESLIAQLSIVHPNCGELDIFLKSPSGTMSHIMTRRPFDRNRVAFSFWEFPSLHFWGEDPEGLWKLIVVQENTPGVGVIRSASLVLYGTADSSSLNGSR